MHFESCVLCGRGAEIVLVVRRTISALILLFVVCCLPVGLLVEIGVAVLS